jgi:hypothetical protein
MEWKVGQQRSLYVDDWLDVRVADVELPDGKHLEHRLVCTRRGAGVVLSTGASGTTIAALLYILSEPSD